MLVSRARWGLAARRDGAEGPTPAPLVTLAVDPVIGPHLLSGQQSGLVLPCGMPLLLVVVALMLLSWLIWPRGAAKESFLFTGWSRVRGLRLSCDASPGEPVLPGLCCRALLNGRATPPGRWHAGVRASR